MSANNASFNHHYQSITALVVDDQLPMANILKGMLSSLGLAKVLVARNGKDALHILENRHVDIILSDWNMPKMNGLSLLKALRNEMSSSVPFIMVTANIRHKDVQQAIDAGVSEYLIKPFNSNYLEDKLAKAFSSSCAKPKSRIPAQKEVMIEGRSLDIPSKLNSILIVDDEPNNIAVLTELLKDTYNLQACLSGKKALKICDKNVLPDLILLDIMMPEMDGLTVCQRFKDNPLTEHIPIIFISALSQTQDVVKGLSLGAVDYISKPIIPEITLARISTQMKQLHQRQDMVAQLDTMMENMRQKEDIEQITQHDLRNPLSVIISAAHALQENKQTNTDEVSLILDSSQTMHQMLDEQLLIQQLENNSTERPESKLNAFELFNKIVYGQKDKCKANEVLVQYKIDKGIYFLGNNRLSFNLFNNLLANAIEASPANGEVSIKVEKEEALIIFKLHNQGAIPEEIQPRFFDKFITAGKASGTGLGTYSAKLAANAQGGDITFTSSIEAGTTLVVKLKSAS